jgi:Ricin-type beta-trefoil lectin domain-like
MFKKTDMKKILTFFSLIVLFSACKEDDYIAPAAPGRMIKSYNLESGQVGDELINGNADPGKIIVKVASTANLAALVPNIVISDRATISPASGQPVDITQNNEMTYIVTSESGQQKEWLVEFQVVSNEVSDYGAYILKSIASEKNLSVAGDTLQDEKYWDNANIILENPNADNVPALKKYQKWHIIYASTTNDVKYYKLRNMFTGKFISAPLTNTTTDGAQLLQRGYSPTGDNEDQMLWKIENADGVFTIVNKVNGLVLTDLPAAQLGQVAQALQTAQSGAETQKWNLIPIQSESYKDDVFNNFFERNDNAMGSVAFDQGNSIPLSSGRVLWVTQDAYDGEPLLGNDMFNCNQIFHYNNSILIQPTATDWDPAHTVNMTNSHPTAAPRLMFDDTPGNDWIWPGGGVEIGNKVYLIGGEGQGLSNNNFAMYILTQNAGTSWDVERRTPGGVSGTAGWVKGGDGYVYTFQPEGYSFGYLNYIHVGRFAETDPDTWTFWNGTSWVQQVPTGSTGSVFTGLGNNSVDMVNGKYVVMTVDQGFNCDADRGKVYLATSDSPTGPFTTKKLVYQITDYINGQYTRYYTTIIHPHADNGHQELLLSFSVNYGACAQQNCTNGFLDPYYYRIKGIRVPYEMIGL